ncbi:hypothetical protein [Apis mellifera associated microvirus 8]|nr:hypothetical protein [Apis mellifera associated microvirus 8]
MLNVTILRAAATPTGIYGILLIGSVPICLTLERPWLDNVRSYSCIPPGVYKCSKTNTTRYKNVFILWDVPDRSGILIHAGNSIADTRGCILVGRSFYDRGITQSRLTLDTLNSILPESFTLTIRDPLYDLAGTELG